MPDKIETPEAASKNPLKILVSAFAVSPKRGSEYAVGWEWITHIAQKHWVWVITHQESRPEIEQYVRDHRDEMEKVFFHFLPFRENQYPTPLRQIVYRSRYICWQKSCYRLAQRLDKDVSFDIVHHVNGTGFREPGFLWKLGKPFVWGPMGGLQYFPLRFLPLLPFGAGLFVTTKNLTTAWMMHCSRRPRDAAQSSGSIIAATRNTAIMVKKLWAKESTVLSEVTPPSIEQLRPPHRAPGAPLRIVWCGRIDPYKALPLLILALSELRNAQLSFELTVIGTGVQERYCIELANRCGISGSCKFLGRLSRTDALKLMRHGHVFVHTSLYELTGTVIVEALQVGMPLIGLDHCGFSDVVDDSCGIKISARRPAQAVHGIAAALKRTWEDEAGRYSMALKAQEMARRLSWPNKLMLLDSVYSAVRVASLQQNQRIHLPLVLPPS